jgi:lysine-N-methylase
MSLPLRNLPVLQNWDCHGCSHCCRIDTPVSDEEKERIEALDLAGDAHIAAGPWFERRGWGQWVLKHGAENRCVFLTAANRCRLHERFGAAAKPFACRLFPFLLVPAGDHWRVGLHYSCPSAAQNQGRPVSDRVGELASLIPLLEKHVGRSGDSAPPPPLDGGQPGTWPDILRLVQVFVDMVQDRGSRLETRLRKVLALARLCRHARLDNLKGGKLSEFLHVVRKASAEEVPHEPDAMAPPGWIGRVLFRAMLGIYARRDLGLLQGSATRTRLGRLRAGWRFVRGQGSVPRVNSLLVDTTFAQLEVARTWPPTVDSCLERYYVTKLNSLQFFGPPNFNLPFWTGLDSLVLTLPMILWLARSFAAMEPAAAVQQAMVLVDHHFGSNRLLGSRLVRFYLRTLAERGEIDRLVAWYSR